MKNLTHVSVYKISVCVDLTDKVSGTAKVNAPTPRKR